MKFFGLLFPLQGSLLLLNIAEHIYYFLVVFFSIQIPKTFSTKKIMNKVSMTSCYSCIDTIF